MLHFPDSTVWHEPRLKRQVNVYTPLKCSPTGGCCEGKILGKRAYDWSFLKKWPTKKLFESTSTQISFFETRQLLNYGKLFLCWQCVSEWVTLPHQTANPINAIGARHGPGNLNVSVVYCGPVKNSLVFPLKYII